MNQQDTIPGPKPSVASAVGSPGVRGICSRLTSRFTPARGEVSAHRTAAWLAWVLWALSVLLLLGYIPLRYHWQAVAASKGATLPPEDIAALQTNLLDVINDVFLLTALLSFSTLGALIVSRARERRIGWLFCAIGLVWATHVFTGVYAVYTLLVVRGSLPAGLAAAWFQHWIWLVAWGLLGVFLPLLYPTGRLVSRRWTPVSIFAVGLIAGITVLDVFAPGPLGNYLDDFQTKIPNPLGITALGPVVEGSDPIASLLFLLLPLVSAASLILRLRRASGDERAQLKWFAYLAALLVVLFVANNLLSNLFPLQKVALAAINLVTALAGGSLPLLTGLAILKYRLYDIDRLINRTLVYGTLTASVVGLYVLLVGGLGALFRSSENPFLAILATGLVALLFHPVRERLQRGVNRLLYGQRDEPYQVLARLGQRLENTVAPGAILPTLVETVRDALKLSYVAVALQQEETVTLAAVVGEPTEALLTLPLSYQGELVGHLLLGSRWRDEPFRSADRRLLDDLARQAGVAVYAARLTTDLQRARERLVVAREEERRRLRRDLHDGLGPALSSQLLTLDAISRLFDRDLATARALLNELRAQSQAAFLDIRRLIYDLRPPALDDLGLVAALQESLARYRQSGLECIVEVAEPLPALPAAVEVAVYQIAQEAITNVARHAGARTCQVCLALTTSRGQRGLCLEVLDDGCGLPATRPAGVGLRSMRERAEELGGFLVIEGRSGGGTRVSTWLPVPEEETCT